MKRTFLSGLALLLPLAVTLLIVIFILNFLTNPFIKLFDSYFRLSNIKLTSLISPNVLHYTVQFVILFLLFVFTTLVGMLGRLFFINYFLKLGDSIINRLPVVKTIYKTTKDILKSLFSPDTESFKQVVLAPFPTKDRFCLGLVSGPAPKSCLEKSKDELVTVLLPTAPHPISGYLLLFKKKDLIATDMSIEDAIKFTISCGIVHPEKAPS